MERNLPKTLSELAAMDNLPRGAYMLPIDKTRAIFVESVQQLADEVYIVNESEDELFTGFEEVKYVRAE